MVVGSATSTSVLIDSWWFKPRDLEFACAGIEKVGADSVVEVWYDVPAEPAKDRYLNRQRAELYQDGYHLANDWPKWAEPAEPLDLAPVVRVDTTHPVDCAALAERIKRASVPQQ